ncbi:MAG: hypothetical protein IH944_14315, partial [Armatimonadetes bacterium]|nr:hypothetical protein [Armatimonadota bacterium]
SHEFGHVLDLPDLYHPIDGLEPQNRRWVLGCWGLMAAGSWGCGDGSTRGASFGPTHFSPWSKEQLGWIQWIDVGDVFDEEFVLGPAQQSRQALLVPLDDVGAEFLVLEYRPQTGFDAGLPSSGVLMYHWDTEGARRPPRGTDGHYLFAMVEADGRTDLRLTSLNGGNRGEASDAWGLDASRVLLNNETSPGTRRHAGSAPSRVTVHSISVAGGEARVRLTTSRVPGIVDVGALPDGSHFNPYTGRLTIAGGLMPYTAFIDDTLPSRGMTVATDGMELVVGGAPEVMGDIEFGVSIEDSQGNVGTVVVPITVGEFVMTLERALTPFLDSEAVPINAGEQAILDSRGNDNGFYDIDSVFVAGRGHFGAIQADFNINEPADDVKEIKFEIETILNPGDSAAGTAFAYNWGTDRWDYVKAVRIKNQGNKVHVIRIRQNPGDYVSVSGVVRVIFRVFDQFKRNGKNPQPFRMRTDVLRAIIVTN